MPQKMIEITVLAPGTVVSGELVKCVADKDGKVPPGVHYRAPEPDALLLMSMGKALYGHVPLDELKKKPPTDESARLFNRKNYFDDRRNR